jgi:DNA-directed RNA polymerase subunit RPC12/RpoP
MGWKAIERLSCLIREEKGLRLTCNECGHTAEPDVRTLRQQVTLRGGFWASLSELHKYIRCGQCGSKGFRYELLPLTPPTSDGPGAE